MIKKKLKLGDWAVGAINRTKYNADLFEFSSRQLEKIGIPQFGAEVTGLAGVAEQGA